MGLRLDFADINAHFTLPHVTDFHRGRCAGHSETGFLVSVVIHMAI